MKVRLFGVTLLMASIAGSIAHGQQDPQQAGGQAPQGLELTPQAYVQLDWRGYPDWTVAPGSGRLEFNIFDVRRLRAGLDGEWRQIAFEVTVDPQDFDGTTVKDAYGQIAFGRGYRLRAGQFKLPGSREYGTAARSTDLLERSGLATSLAAHRDIGVALHGDVGSRVDYDAGLFAGDNNGANGRAGLTATARLEWEPSADLVVAAFGSEGRLSAVETDPENGLNGRLPSGYRFFDNVYVQGRRTRLGGDVEWSPGPWQFTVEALRVRDERQEQGVDVDDLPSVVGVGASATVRWRFASRRDVTARYEYLGFDDVGPDTSADSVRPRAANVRARSGQALTFGGSWRVQPWARLMGDAGFEWYSETRSAPEASRGGPYLRFGTRLQIELPDMSMRLFGGGGQ